MAAPLAQPTETRSEYGSDWEIHSIETLSDYGSDIGLEDLDEDTILGDVLDTIGGATQIEKSTVLPSIEFEQSELEDDEQDVDGFVQIHGPRLLRVARGNSGARVHVQREAQSSPVWEHDALEVEYNEASRRARSGMSQQWHRTWIHRLTADSA